MSALQQRLAAALRDAMRERDRVATAVLRSVLGEIGNAEAVPPADPPAGVPPSAGPSAAGPPAGVSHIAGAVAGVGSTEVARRELSDEDVEAIVRAEVDGRIRAAHEYRELGRDDEAEGLDAEVSVLRSLLA